MDLNSIKFAANDVGGAGDSSANGLPKTENELILYICRRMWLPLLACSIVGAVTAAVNVASIGVTATLVNIFSGSVGQHDYNVFYICVFLALSVGLEPLTQFVSAKMLSKYVSVPIIRTTLWNGLILLQTRPISFFNENLSGQSASAIKQLTKAIQKLLSGSVEFIPRSFVRIIGSMSLLYYMAYQLALPCMVWSILLFFLTRRSVHYQVRAGVCVAKTENATFGELVDNFSNIQLVKVFANEDYETQRFAGVMRDHLNALKNYDSTVIITNLYINILNALLVVALFIIAVFGLESGALQAGDLVAGMMVARNLTGHSSSMTSYSQMVSNTLSTIRACLPVFADGRFISKDSTGSLSSLASNKIKIEFNNVSFEYSSGDKIFDQLNFKISSGERVGIVGTSGAGKTTIINLLLRLYDPTEGSISVNGVDIRTYTLKSLRGQIGVVLQDTSLFHRTIRENISYGSTRASDHKVNEAIIRAQASEFISRLKDKDGQIGLDAKVGERGVRLSGGQRQRIAIARVILRDAPLLLLDEATSALDSETEGYIQSQLDEIFASKTVLVIAHRLSTVMKMDRLIVLEDGKIVEEGSPADLCKSGGRLAKILEKQQRIQSII